MLKVQDASKKMQIKNFIGLPLDLLLHLVPSVLSLAQVWNVAPGSLVFCRDSQRGDPEY